jgi:hypothetical protein
VAELADAQVSEACDGDIVEVQVLSSAPFLSGNKGESDGARFSFWNPPGFLAFIQKDVTSAITTVSYQ